MKGDANDYVAKGLSGATISIKLQEESNLISNENINIEMITTSEIRITCIVHEDQLTKAAQSLHKAFELDAD